MWAAGGCPTVLTNLSEKAERERLHLSANLLTVHGWPGLAWIAVMASPITESIAPVSQPAVASGLTAYARSTLMNRRSRILEIISADPADGEIFSCMSICVLTSNHTRDWSRAPRRSITGGRA